MTTDSALCEGNFTMQNEEKIQDAAAHLRQLLSKAAEVEAVPEALHGEVRAICQSLLDAVDADQMGWGPD